MRPRPGLDDRLVRLWSADEGAGSPPLEYELGKEKRGDDWGDYVQGVSFVLARAGIALRGFDARVESAVPIGSGLSSSAALEIAMMRALRLAFELPIDDVAMARYGQLVENDFVGARVGIMDQMASSLAGRDEALFLDTRDLGFRRVAIPVDRLELLVINSGVSHRNVGGGYNQRRSECEAACAAMGADLLRAFGPATSRASRPPSPT